MQTRLFKSLKLWSFYVDLEESIGTVETTKAVYDRIFELKIANAQIVINYANFLEENQYWEESFKVSLHGPCLSFMSIILTAKPVGVRARSRPLYLPHRFRDLEHVFEQVHEAICEFPRAFDLSCID